MLLSCGGHVRPCKPGQSDSRKVVVRLIVPSEDYRTRRHSNSQHKSLITRNLVQRMQLLDNWVTCISWEQLAAITRVLRRYSESRTQRFWRGFESCGPPQHGDSDVSKAGL